MESLTPRTASRGDHRISPRVLHGRQLNSLKKRPVNNSPRWVAAAAAGSKTNDPENGLPGSARRPQATPWLQPMSMPTAAEPTTAVSESTALETSSVRSGLTARSCLTPNAIQARWGVINAYVQQACQDDVHRRRREAKATQRSVNEVLDMQIAERKQREEEERAEEQEEIMGREAERQRALAEEVAKRRERDRKMLELQQEHRTMLEQRRVQKKQAKERDRQEANALHERLVAEANVSKEKERQRALALQVECEKAREVSIAARRRRKEEEKELDKHYRDLAIAEAEAAAQQATEQQRARERTSAQRYVVSQQAQPAPSPPEQSYSSRGGASERDTDHLAAKQAAEELARLEVSSAVREADRQAAVAKMEVETQACVLRQMQEKRARNEALLEERQRESARLEADLRDLKAVQTRKALSERERLFRYQQDLAAQVTARATGRPFADAMSDKEARINKNLLEAVHDRAPMSEVNGSMTILFVGLPGGNTSPKPNRA